MSSAFSESFSHRSLGDKDFQSFRNSLKESGRIDDSEREGLSGKLQLLEEEKDKVPNAIDIHHREKSSIADLKKQVYRSGYRLTIKTDDMVDMPNPRNFHLVDSSLEGGLPREIIIMEEEARLLN